MTSPDDAIERPSGAAGWQHRRATKTWEVASPRPTATTNNLKSEPNFGLINFILGLFNPLEVPTNGS